MEEVLRIAMGTVALRPYVFAFLGAYLVAAGCHLGWRTTLSFTGIGYLIAFASEFSSINTGFPYGWYYYIDVTSHQELWVAGVPFFDSLSYAFLTYSSYATALLIIAPLRTRRWDVIVLETLALRRSPTVLLLAALLQTYLDIIIDPVALRGDRWFLGSIYGYREPGVHFGVPLSNYAGWLVTSLCLVLALQILDARLGGGESRRAGLAALPFRSLFGPLIYLAVLAFNLGVTFAIDEQLLGITGIFIVLLPTIIVTMLLVLRANRFSREELEEHRRDFPFTTAAD